LPVGEFIDSDIRYLKKLKNGETPFEVKITGANAIYGFPANVFAWLNAFSWMNKTAYYPCQQYQCSTALL